LPGGELLLWLNGPENGGAFTAYDRFSEQSSHPLEQRRPEIEFGASWGVLHMCGEALHQMLGQLSWLAEKASAGHQVLALTNCLQAVAGQIMNRVLQLNKLNVRWMKMAFSFMASQLLMRKGRGTRKFSPGLSAMVKS
jgi:hypothetical protein